MKRKEFYEPLDLKNRFLRFIENYTLPNHFQPYCLKQILKKFIKKNINININLAHIAEFDPQLYIKITEFPGELVCFFDYILNETFFGDIFFRKNQIGNKFRISFWCRKLEFDFNIHEVSSGLFNKVISIHGKIVKTTKDFSELSSILFKCEICEFETYSLGDLGTIQEPVYCFLCKNFNSFKILTDRCYFNKIKFLKIQNQNFTGKNQNRGSNLLLIYRNHISKSLATGDTVKATGILRIHPFFDKIKKLNSIFFGIYLDSMYIHKSNKNNEIYHKFKKDFFEENNQIDYFNHKDQRIMFTSLTQNFNFYQVFQDSCFSGRIGIETIKKTFAMIYCQKFKNAINVNMIIKHQNVVEEILNLKTIPKNFKKFIHIDGKNDKEPNITFSIDPTDDWNDNKIIKGKLLNNHPRICFFENLDYSSSYVIQILKEIITSQKISLFRTGLNCCLDLQHSIIVFLNKFGSQFFSEKTRKTFEKDIDSLVNLFDLAYLLKRPGLYTSQNYTLKLFNHIFHKKPFVINPKRINLERTGFKFEGTKFLFDFKRKNDKFFIPPFSLVEIIKMNNLTKILTKIKLKKKWKSLKNFSILTKSIATNLAIFRLSKIIALEDIRLAFVLVSESLKSDDFLKN